MKLSAQRIVKLPPLAAVVKKNGSPKGCGIPSLRAKRSNFTGSQSRFHPAKAGFHSARTGRISLLLPKGEIVPVGTVKFSPKARVKLSAQRIVKLPPLAAVVMKNGSPRGCGIPSLRAKRSNFTGSQSRFHPEQAGFHSARMGRISLLLPKGEIVPVGTVKFSPKARVKLSAQRIVKLPPSRR